MKAKITIAALALCAWQGLFAQPLVYNVENSGTSCAPPPLPAFSALPRIDPLPDPFLWANGSGRSTSFSDWECHRNEFKRQIENYEIGIKPPKPDTLTASYAATSSTAGTLTVTITRNGQTMTLTSAIALPATSGPWPAVIGMNSASGSVPAAVFTGRNIARITYSHDQVTTYGNPALTNPFYRLYPEYNLVNSGQYSAWAWGVSRIIDGLQLVQASLPINLQKIGVTGCSYAGKMALYSGAFDERIALTIAQESGGGGAPAWRVSHSIEPDGTVEKIDNTDYRWFRDSMMQFAADNVYKLPHDHHELMAMVAPRALLVTGNTDFTWLSNQANYVSARATKSIYNTLGISERFGFYIDGGHGHCAVPTSQVPAMQAFVDKYLADILNVNTDTITVNPFPTLNYRRWFQWWGTGNPVLPPLPPDPLGKRIYLEAECATVGSSWQLLSDTAASGGIYAKAKTGLSSTTAAPTADSAYVVMPFTIDSAAAYNFVARLNVPTGEDFSYWLKIDNGAFATVSNQLIPANAGFENGISGWSILNSNGATITGNAVAADAHTGNGSMKVVNPTAQTGNQWRVQVTSAAFPTTIGKQYTISYWVRAASPNGSIRLSTGPSGAQYQADQVIGTSWQQVSWTITASITSTTFLFDMGQVANTYYIDDASVKEVSADGWRWVKLATSNLGIGQHNLTIAYRDGNAKLDKMLVTTSNATITGKGLFGVNCCPAPTARLYVYDSASGGNGASWDCAYDKLYKAIDYANTHYEIKEIWVAKGMYTPLNNGNRASRFEITRGDLKIIGGFSPGATQEGEADPEANQSVLSGDVGTENISDNSYNIFYIHDMYSSSTPGILLKNLTLEKSNGFNGGAIYMAYVANGNNTRIEHCTFRNNAVVGSGGAIYLDNADPLFVDCVFEGNTASSGGAICAFQASPTFRKTAFKNNMAMNGGGAYYGNYGNPVFRDMVFTGNTAGDGGAMYQNNMNADYINSVFHNNHADNQGSAVYVHNGKAASMLNCTLYGNNTTSNGGAVFTGYNGATVKAYNTIFWNNTRGGSSNGGDYYNSGGSAPTFRNSMLQANTLVDADNGVTLMNNTRGVAPTFANAANAMGADGKWYTADDGLRLLCNAAPSLVEPVTCGAGINSGDNSVVSSNGVTADIMGNPRTVCAIVDRGAYELQACNSVAVQTETEELVNNSMAVKLGKEESTSLVANPFSNQLQVRYAGSNKASISIVNATGKVVAQKGNLSAGIHSFDATMWSKGLYNVIVVSQTGKKEVFKAIKF